MNNAPDGFQNFGLGPLPFKAGSSSEDVFSSCPHQDWSGCAGRCSTSEYALRRGSEIHKINFAAKLVNLIRSLSGTNFFGPDNIYKEGFVYIGKGVKGGFIGVFALGREDVWSGGGEEDAYSWSNNWFGTLANRNHYITRAKYNELKTLTRKPPMPRREYSAAEALAKLEKGDTIFNSENNQVFAAAPNQKYYKELKPVKPEIKIGDIVSRSLAGHLWSGSLSNAANCLVAKAEEEGERNDYLLLIELGSGNSCHLSNKFIQEDYIKVSDLEKEFPNGFVKK